MDIDPAARVRLAALMEARALHLGLNWREVAARAGVSYEIVRRLRTSSTSVRPLTLRKVDDGLSWEPGSIERILNGGDPVPLAEPPARDDRLTAEDEFERHILASALPYADKAAAIRRHREQAREQLAALGIEPPAFLRGGVRRLAGESASSDEDRHRGASGT